MKRRLWLVIALIAALTISACSSDDEGSRSREEAAAAQGEAPPAAEAVDSVAEFHSAWPYAPAPTGHFNSWVANGMTLGIYRALMEPPLFLFRWADESWLPVAGESWEWVDDSTVRVSLIQGAVWSDSSSFTSQDVIDTFDIARLLSQPVWRFLSDVQAVDDHTVDFKLAEPSATAPRRALREVHTTASSVYGDFAQRTRDLVEAGMSSHDGEWERLLQEFVAFRPQEMVVLGPYQIDPGSITDSQLVLKKVEGSYWADKVRFDRVVNYNGDMPVITTLALSGDVDYATHAFPPDSERQFISKGYRIIRAPTYSGPALYFNHAIHPFQMKEVRQALAFAINFEENAYFSLADSGVAQACMCGFSDNLTARWLGDGTPAAMNPYAQNLELAERILLTIGFTRADDGVWVDDTGARMEWELTAPAEYSDWSAAGVNVAEQLTNFGFKTGYRGVNFQQHPIDVNEGRFQLAIRGWGAGNPHPTFSYQNNFGAHNAAATGVSGSIDLPGMSFDLNVSSYTVGDVDLWALTRDAGAGGDRAAQIDVLDRIAMAYNELLPQIPLWERYGNNPVPSRFASGWLPEGDPIYVNSPYADSFVVIQILTGQLGPAE